MYFHLCISISCLSIRGCALFSLWNSPHHGRLKTVENKGSNVQYNKINITFPDWLIVENIIPRNMIINLGCASVDNHIPRDDIFDYHPIRACNIYIKFNEKMRLPFRLKSSLAPHSLAFNAHSHFGMNYSIASLYRKITCNIFSVRYSVRVQLIQPFLKFLYLFSLIRYI